MLVLDYVQINQHSKLMLIKFTINLLSLLILKSPYFSYTSNDQTSKYYQYLMQSRHNLLLEYIDGKNQILQEDIIQNKLQINSISSLLIEMSKMKTYFIQMIKYTVFQFKKKKDLLNCYKKYYSANLLIFGLLELSSFIQLKKKGQFSFKGSKDNELFQLIFYSKINFHSINDHYLQDLLCQILQFVPQDRISAARVSFLSLDYFASLVSRLCKASQQISIIWLDQNQLSQPLSIRLIYSQEK
ncbi:unnamed protein product [Paramecium octaurelia]|uniref:Uncharacterized protein n=1 Tax=Paramecium octaurelia TaxID=43137 RepID=A0A8S1UQR0_PAROT|nr:unnamed protein product [Paramecium octaurelia]